MGRFERFMEAWGLVTMDWMRSSSRVKRWCGLLLGATACRLMFGLMVSWATWNATIGYLRRALGKK